jgi:hypothetical protein
MGHFLVTNNKETIQSLSTLLIVTTVSVSESKLTNDGNFNKQRWPKYALREIYDIRYYPEAVTFCKFYYSIIHRQHNLSQFIILSK